MNKKKIRYLGCTGAGILALLLADQYTKYLAQEYLKDQADIIWIPQVFQLHYLENRGAAFGLLQNQKFIFWLCALYFSAPLFFFCCKCPPHPAIFHFISLRQDCPQELPEMELTVFCMDMSLIFSIFL